MFDKDIVETAIGAGTFKTLVTAVQAAGLVETLKGPGPYTVFAPSDDAFAKVPKDTLNGLLKDRAALSRILTYHVVPGKHLAAQVAKMDVVQTAAGLPLKIASTAAGVMVGTARVVKADIEARNGVIHVIDTVLIP